MKEELIKLIEDIEDEQLIKYLHIIVSDIAEETSLLTQHVD